MNTERSRSAGKMRARKIDPQTFGHRQHVELAFEMLSDHPFLEATTIYSDTIRALSERVGAPEKFNLTITVAFMSLIAERMMGCEASDSDDFIGRNQDLLSVEILQRYYSRERLWSPLARRVLLLPDRCEFRRESPVEAGHPVHTGVATASSAC